jgi:SH3-like domain-containing protein
MLGMIGVAEEYKGLLAQIRDEGKTKWINEGKMEGKRDIINAMLKKFSIDTVCDFLDMERSEVEDILGD